MITLQMTITYNSFFYTRNIALNYRFICKINIKGYFIRNAPSSIKYSYFAHVIISPTLKKCKWLKRLCAYSANDHVLQSFQYFS